MLTNFWARTTFSVFTRSSSQRSKWSQGSTKSRHLGALKAKPVIKVQLQSDSRLLILLSAFWIATLSQVSLVTSSTSATGCSEKSSMNHSSKNVAPYLNSTPWTNTITRLSLVIWISACFQKFTISKKLQIKSKNKIIAHFSKKTSFMQQEKKTIY